MYKLLFFIKCIFSHLYFKVLNLVSYKRKGVINNSNYVISLTSYHKRFDTLYLVIESLLRQKYKPRKIFLFLSKEDISIYGGFPKNLEEMQSRGLFIKVLDFNHKSYKKLSYIHPCLKKYNDIDYIITADDDIFYPKKWSKLLIDKSSNEVVSCFRGHDLIKNKFGFDYINSMKNNTSLDSPDFKLIPTGCSGICYPINSISDDNLSDFKLFTRLAPDADDIWYKGITLSRGYRCARVYKHNVHFPLVISSLKDSLYSSNVFDDKNSQKIDKVFEFFKLNVFFES